MKESARLGDHVLKVGSGQTPSGGQANYLQTGIPLIRSQNVLMGSFSGQGLAYISEEQDMAMPGSRVLPGDVLLNITGASIGRVCMAPEAILPANVNQHVCIIRCKDTLLPEYLAYVLASSSLQRFIWDSQAGATRQALTKQMIEEFEIPWVDIDQQRKIVSRLKLDLAAVEDARQAASCENQDLTALGNAIVRDSLNHPETQTFSLGDVLDEVRAGVGTGWAEFPVLGATRGGLALAKEPVGKNPERYKPVQQGSVFYNPMRILIGSIAMVDDGDTPGITSPDYVVLRGREGRVDSRWFYYWLRSPYGERCIASLARGAVRERMLFNRLAEGEITLPPLHVQQAASQALAEIRPLKTHIEKQLREIELLPERLLAQAFQE